MKTNIKKKIIHEVLDLIGKDKEITKVENNFFKYEKKLINLLDAAEKEIYFDFEFANAMYCDILIKKSCLYTIEVLKSIII